MNIEESTRKHIAQELKINQSSQCPQIVVCYQSFYDNGAISMVLEYMDGGSLADLLKKSNKIPEQYLAAISKQVIEAISFFLNGLCEFSMTIFILLFHAIIGTQRLGVSPSRKAYYPPRHETFKFADKSQR